MIVISVDYGPFSEGQSPTPIHTCETIAWREGTNAPLTSRFARRRIRIARRDHERSEPWPEEWLLIEWPQDEKEPTKYWLSTLPEDIEFARLVDLAKLRWRIERDYRELKQEVGLGHFEGRGWGGFHHHATLSIAAYGFLICEREAIPPSGMFAAALVPPPCLPEDRRPRGAPAPDRAPRPKLYDAIVDAASRAWNKLTAEPGRLTSLTWFPWVSENDESQNL